MIEVSFSEPLPSQWSLDDLLELQLANKRLLRARRQALDLLADARKALDSGKVGDKLTARKRVVAAESEMGRAVMMENTSAREALRRHDAIS